MKRTLAALVVSACTVSGVGGLTASAAADQTSSALLSCPGSTYVVTGFGRGEVLHVTGSVSAFVVSYARLEPSGQVLVDIPGLRDRADLLTCTTTTPRGTGYTFRGFLTPR